MPSYLITYDLAERRSPHQTFIEEAEQADLLYVWKGSTDLWRLPNTTIWGIFPTVDKAKAAFDQALAATEKRLGGKVTVEKRVITGFRDYSVKSDRHKQPAAKWTETSDFETSRLHQLNDPYFAY